MTLLDLHIALASSLGDPVVYDATGVTKEEQLSGNVRYSARLKESYLQRAMEKIYADAFSVIADRTRYKQSRILQTWFPTSTQLLTDATTDIQEANLLITVPNVAFVYSLAMRHVSFAPPLTGHLYGQWTETLPDKLNHGHFVGGVNVPIYGSDEAYRRATSRGILDGSPYAYLIGYPKENRTVIHVMAHKYFEAYFKRRKDTAHNWWKEVNNIGYEITYLCKAPDLSKLALTDDVDFETMYHADILKYATAYGLLDSQDIESNSDAAQMLYAKHFILQQELPQQGGSYAGL